MPRNFAFISDDALFYIEYLPNHKVYFDATSEMRKVLNMILIIGQYFMVHLYLEAPW